MIKYLQRTACIIMFLFSVTSTGLAYNVYLGSLGYGNPDAETNERIQELSNLLQLHLMRISNNEITYQPLNTDKELSTNYNGTIIDSQLRALSACISYNIDTVFYGTVYIDPGNNLCTSIVKIYDKSNKKNILEITYSKIMTSDMFINYTQDLSVQINAVFYEYVTGTKYQVPFKTLEPPPTLRPTPVKTPLPTPVPTSIPTPVQVSVKPAISRTPEPGKTPVAPALSLIPVQTEEPNIPEVQEEDDLRTDIKKIVEMLNNFDLKLNEIKEKSIPAINPEATAEPADSTKSTDTAKPADTARPADTGKQADTAGILKPWPADSSKQNQAEKDILKFDPALEPVKKAERQYFSLNTGAGYFFSLEGKWQYPVIPIITIEEGIKFRMYLVDTPLFKLFMRQGASLSYSYFKEHPDNEFNRYMHLHALKARLGLDFYCEFSRVFGLYLGGGAHYAYNSVDFRTPAHIFYSDTHYALGAYGNAGAELLFGNMGLGCDNIFDITFFNTMMMDYKIMLSLSVKF